MADRAGCHLEASPARLLNFEAMPTGPGCRRQAPAAGDRTGRVPVSMMPRVSCVVFRLQTIGDWWNFQRSTRVGTRAELFIST